MLFRIPNSEFRIPSFLLFQPTVFLGLRCYATCFYGTVGSYNPLYCQCRDNTCDTYAAREAEENEKCLPYLALFHVDTAYPITGMVYILLYYINGNGLKNIIP